MKISFTLILSCSLLIATNAQEPAKGFKKGSIVLADSSTLTGSIKDNMKSNASVQFQPDANGKKKSYSGSELISAEIDGVKFICIKGDFFKVLCQGQLCFLQKASDASGKPVYNGAEAVFASGTEGKPSDYFIYHSNTRELKLISKKNVDEVTAAVFAGNTAAIEKAKNINGDIASLKEAVEIYNNRETK